MHGMAQILPQEYVFRLQLHQVVPIDRSHAIIHEHLLMPTQCLDHPQIMPIAIIDLVPAVTHFVHLSIINIESCSDAQKKDEVNE
jgi:hypothetical protein